MPNLAALRLVLDAFEPDGPPAEAEPESSLRELPLGPDVQVHPDGEINSGYYDGVRVRPFVHRLASVRTVP